MSTKRLHTILEKDLGPFTFGMFMRVARNTLELTQAEMAKKLGIARGTLCDIEKGRQLVSATLAVKVAKKAGLSPEVAVRACLQDQVNKAGIERRVELIA
jgi:DNA-binding XRE family transcriptional regulator